jgi:predicted lipoprotein with Yx(FWY)xxD motif
VTRPGTLLAVVAAVAVAALAAILLTRGSPSANQHVRAASAPSATVPDVGVRRGRLGRMLVTDRGRTLYLFLKDRHGHSACTGVCARVWPPLIVSGRPRAGAGVSGGRLTTTARPNHARQVVYAGHPLYTMSADSRPGDTAGQGFLGTWFVVSPAGHRIGKATGGGY